MSDLYEQKFRTAKKRHRCECCGKIIKPGERYSFEKFFNDDNGCFNSTKLCTFCYYASEDYFDEGGDRQEFVWEEVSEYLQDKYCRDCSKYEEDTCEYERHSDCPIVKAAIFDRRGIEHEQT